MKLNEKPDYPKFSELQGREIYCDSPANKGILKRAADGALVFVPKPKRKRVRKPKTA